MKRIYAEILPALRLMARGHGYALAVHGSGERDLDLIAVPWVENADDAETLVETLRESVSGVIANSSQPETLYEPVLKPHGRRAWTILLHPAHYDDPINLFIDLSVMPLKPEIHP